MSDTASIVATPIIDNAAIHKRFVRKAGIAYGLVFALGFAACFWLPDALALQQASAQLAWAKLLLGLIICLPLGMLIGWLAASARWSGISILLWTAGGITTAWVAGHIPYEGLSWFASLTDPYPASHVMYPMSLPAAGATGISMVIGAGTGLLIGILSLIATEQAWSQSTQKHHFSAKSILALCICLPFVLGFSLFTDYQINSALRESFVSVSQSIRIALDPNRDLDAARLFFLKPYRDRMTPNFTLEWVKSAADVDDIDVQFDNGLLVRCRYSFGFTSLCTEFGPELDDWMTQLMNVGHLTCTGCSAQADRATRRWLAASLPSMGNLRDVKFLQHQGGGLYERATFDSGRRIDCRFSSNSPALIDLCLEAK